MDLFVRFQNHDDPDDHGTWYRIIGDDPDPKGVRTVDAEMIYPSKSHHGHRGNVYGIVKRGNNDWVRTEYTREELPDWLIVEIAKAALLGSNNG